MSGMSKEQAERIADLARLRLTGEEAERFARQLTDFLQFFEKANEVDTSNVEPTVRVFEAYNVMREDEIRPSIEREKALKNAPNHDEEYFQAPAVMD